MVQATVSMWDEQLRSARVVLDDGRELAVADGAVDEAGLVRLAHGQRVSIELTSSGEDQLVTRLGLLG